MIALAVTQGIEKSKFREFIDVLRDHHYEIAWAQDLATASAFIHSRESSPKICLIAADENGSPSVEEIEKFIALSENGAFLFYISNKITPTDFKALMRLGQIESIDWVTGPSELNQFLVQSKFDENPRAPKSFGFPKQFVISCLGVGAGAGSTTVAMEVAIALALQSRDKSLGNIAFLDLDLEGGLVCDYLNIEPRLDLNEVNANPQRLDSYMLEMMATKHSSGLDIFSSVHPYNVSRYKAQDMAALSLLNCIVDNYSIALIDIPNRCPIDLSEILRNSDMVFCSGLFSVPSAKRIKSRIAGLLELGIAKENISIVITDTDKNFLGNVTHRFNIGSVFPGWKIFYVRRDRSFAMECADAGVSMMQTQPKRGIVSDIQKIAESVFEKMKP